MARRVAPAGLQRLVGLTRSEKLFGQQTEWMEASDGPASQRQGDLKAAQMCELSTASTATVPVDTTPVDLK